MGSTFKLPMPMVASLTGSLHPLRVPALSHLPHVLVHEIHDFLVPLGMGVSVAVALVDSQFVKVDLNGLHPMSFFVPCGEDKGIRLGIVLAPIHTMSEVVSFFLESLNVRQHYDVEVLVADFHVKVLGNPLAELLVLVLLPLEFLQFLLPI